MLGTQVGVMENQRHVNHVESTRQDVIMEGLYVTAVNNEASKNVVSTTLHPSPSHATQTKLARVSHGH